MISYEEYLNKLKGSLDAQPDYARLRTALERKVSGRKWQFRVALAGACALLLMGFSAYFTYPLWNSNDQLMSYVYGPQEISDGPVIDYVFSD